MEYILTYLDSIENILILCYHFLDPRHSRQGSYKFGPVCTSVRLSIRRSVRPSMTGISRECFIQFFQNLAGS